MSGPRVPSAARARASPPINLTVSLVASNDLLNRDSRVLAQPAYLNADSDQVIESCAANGARAAFVQAARAREAAAGAAETAQAHGPDDEMNVEHEGLVAHVAA